MKRIWTIEELETFLGGVKKHGAGKWIEILKDPQFASSLANQDNKTLTDKWKFFGKYDDSKRSGWTVKEVEALFGGSEKYGVGKWQKVLNDPQFAFVLANRSISAILRKWSGLGGYDHSKSRGNEWTKREMEAFLGGIKKHGVSNWQDILNDPRFSSSLANRSNTDLEDKWCNSDRSCDRRDYTMHPPLSSSKKQLGEEFGDPEDYHNPCTVSRKKRGPFNNMINQISKTRLVEDLHNSQDYHNPCTITRQKRTRNNRVNQGVKECVVEDFNNSQNHLNPCTVIRQRSGSRRKMISQDSEESDVEEVSDSQYESDDHSPCTITRQRSGTWRNRVNQSRKLDSEKVHIYLENLWLNLSEDKRKSVTYLDPLWYNMYSHGSDKEKVLKWIKRKDIFSRRYVVLPIVEGGHWMVLIFCHLGGSLGSTIKTPCILLLDSMAKTEHSNQLDPMIRKFILHIYKSSERTEDPKQLRKMPFLVPKVPQQRDNEECGFFALYYIKLFVENAPESFSVSDGYPYFMKKDWFNFEGLDSFRETLDFAHV